MEMYLSKRLNFNNPIFEFKRRVLNKNFNYYKPLIGKETNDYSVDFFLELIDFSIKNLFA